MEIIGYILSSFIGLSLGLIGGGGSILTVPLLVYLFGISPVVATSYSLFIVGCTSLIGAIRKHRSGEVSMKTALLFGITSITTVIVTRSYLLPALPENLFSIGNVEVTKSMLTMLLFALLMLFASVSMIRKRKDVSSTTKNTNFLPLVLYGLGIGLVTGLLGAGGGFLLIPALVLFVGMDMKKAVGTSLAIIAMNSILGFLGDAFTLDINWVFLLTITLLSLVGLFVGIAFSGKVPARKLKTGFGWFVLIMGMFILIKEVFL